MAAEINGPLSGKDYDDGFHFLVVLAGRSDFALLFLTFSLLPL